MAIQCTKFKIRANGKIYTSGEVIEGLSKEEEARLVQEGYAEYVKIIQAEVPEDEKTNKKESPNDEANDPPEILDDEANKSPEPSEEHEDGPDTGYPDEEIQKAKSQKTRGKRK